MYEISYSDGRRATTETLDGAIALLLAEYPDLEYGHDGDLSDGGDKTLAWACEQDSLGDAGQNAVASIREAR
jgi:hypothetical protein